LIADQSLNLFQFSFRTVSSEVEPCELLAKHYVRYPKILVMVSSAKVTHDRLECMFDSFDVKYVIEIDDIHSFSDISSGSGSGSVYTNTIAAAEVLEPNDAKQREVA